MNSSLETTALLADWASGDSQALNELTRRLYRELRQLAGSYLRKERPGHTLQPTAPVNEAYVRLLEQNETLSCQNRSHFLAIAARLMRQILVDHAGRRQSSKRRGQRVGLEEAISSPSGTTADLISLDSGLQALWSVDPRKCRAEAWLYQRMRQESCA